MYQELAATTTPTPNHSVQRTDVLCGRGKAYNNHEGNINFVNMIKSNVQRYIDAPTRIYRSLIVIELTEAICVNSGIRFLKKDKASDQWIQLETIQAKEKIGHCIRDIKKTRKNNISYVTVKKKQQQCKYTRKSSMTSSDRDDFMKTTLMVSPLPALVRSITDKSSFGTAAEASSERDDLIKTTLPALTRYVTDAWSSDKTPEVSTYEDKDEELIVSFADYGDNWHSDIIVNETLRRSSLCLTYKDLTNEESVINFQF